jgi:predicted dehydrogenase
MKFLVIGLGSMGKRRIRCLKRLGYSDVTGFDLREDRCQEVLQKYEIKAESDWKSAKQVAAEVWIISTPPNLHMNYAFQAIEQKKHFFTEAGVSSDKMNNLINELANNNIIGVPSCTMRYYEGPKKIKELVQNGSIGRPLFFVYHWGQYLPTWHVYESYQDFYVSKRETGACREIVPFNLEWLVDIFGIPKTISCLKDKISDLNADIDDIYQLQLKFENSMMGNLIVEVFSQPAVNLIRVAGTKGTIEFDQHENKFRLYKTEEDKWTQIDLDKGLAEKDYLYAEEPYVEEMKDFIGGILGEKQYPYTFSDDLKIMNLLQKAEQSADQGSHIKTSPNLQ